MRQANVLEQILKRKRDRIAPLSSATLELRQRALAARAVLNDQFAHRLREALRNVARGINCIAEFKRASPSKGNIRAHADPAQTALAYAAGGAAAISVLTEEDYFLGSALDLTAVRAAVNLPVLRKDFIVAESQVYESAIIGADALLLIVAALDDETLTRLRVLTEDTLGMDALVEVHTADEMRRARRSGATIIGINNRDLHTFEVSLETSLRLAETAPAEAMLVSESGLRDAADLRRLRAAGFHGVLIG
ncbi:MAG: indole-3-glycerol phosphate synthase TrpC, partial [Pyrinomonadaceae bacterium]